MHFLRLAEVFPPAIGAGRHAVGRGMNSFTEGVRKVSASADAFLVPDVKGSSPTRASPLASAAVLRDRCAVEVVPMIVARDVNRPALLSSVLASLVLGMDSVALMWGDPYRRGARSNVYDFDSLASAIAAARGLMGRAGVHGRIFAPVNVEKLRRAAEVDRARKRLEAGADWLLAQPPSGDLGVLRSHASLLDSAGLAGKVLLNVFPLRGAADLERCRLRFGWTPPPSLARTARRGRSALLGEARAVARGIRAAGLPGAYVSTRGDPALLPVLLG